MGLVQFHTVRGIARDVKINETPSLFTGDSEAGGRYWHITTGISVQYESAMIETHTACLCT